MEHVEENIKLPLPLPPPPLLPFSHHDPLPLFSSSKTFIMLLFHYSYFLVLIITSMVSVAAHNADTGHHPSTFDELRNALQELGYEIAEGSPEPQPSKLPQGGSIASKNKGCVKTVSVLPYIR